MNLLLSLHRTLYKILTFKNPTARLGDSAYWNLDIRGLNAKSFVISAGAGHDISFELDLVDRTGCRLVLLDPSPTGRETVRFLRLPASIFFEPVALADQTGSIALAKPLNIAEGSWRLDVEGDGDEMPCTTISEIMNRYSICDLDLLKIDIEGFEYQVIKQVLEKKIYIRQICVEIHQGKEFEKSRIDRWKLIYLLYRSGYRLIYHEKWDHTFLHKSEFTL